MRRQALAGGALDASLDEARARLDRLTPSEAFAAQRSGATIIDIRRGENRELEGGIPDALTIPAAGLEGLVGPGTSGRNHQALLGERVILVCNEGHASTLAAARLLEQGMYDVTDIIGGFRAWRARGLPVIEPVTDTTAPMACSAPGERRAG